MEITINELRRMKTEGLILQGCEGDIQEWVDGISGLLAQEDILLEGTKFKNVRSFCYDGLTNLLFPFEDVKINVGKLAIWRLRSYGTFGGTWLSDYVPNKLGGFLDEGPGQETEEHQQAAPCQDISVEENEEPGLSDISMR